MGKQQSGIKQSIVIDLTKPLDESFIPYSTEHYSDPPLELTDWSCMQCEGFHVSRLSLGTQSGTHIDAPRHFLENGATLEALLPDHLMGSYFLLDLPRLSTTSDVAKLLNTYRHEKTIFLRTPENQASQITCEAIQKILSLPPVLLVLAGVIEIDGSKPLEFHRLVARAGKFLVEDLDQRAARQVSAFGELFAFPLRLIGVSGSPCRVIVKIGEARGVTSSKFLNKA
jgi:arylformamidase